MVSSPQKLGNAEKQRFRGFSPKPATGSGRMNSWPGALTESASHQLEHFSSWTLNDVSRIGLFNRVDTKFLLPLTVLPKLLSGLHPHYRALEIGGCRVFNYQNLYFDTPEFHFFAMHHNGKLNRHKVRFRSYSETGRTFLEVKFKANTHRTIKIRQISHALGAGLTQRDRCFLGNKLPSGYAHLVPTLYGRYSRISLADKRRTERLTLISTLIFLPISERKKDFGWGLDCRSETNSMDVGIAFSQTHAGVFSTWIV